MEQLPKPDRFSVTGFLIMIGETNDPLIIIIWYSEVSDVVPTSSGKQRYLCSLSSITCVQ
jgi:hypothetical protein